MVAPILKGNTVVPPEYFVYTKTLWKEDPTLPSALADWKLQTDLYPVSSLHTVSGGPLSFATFIRQVGVTKEHKETSPSTKKALDLANKYVRITARHADGNIEHLWYGVFAEDSIDQTNHVYVSGAQTITAYGLEYILERRMVAFASATGPGGSRVLGYVPSFNKPNRMGPARTQTGLPVGNRSVAPGPLGVYDFDENPVIGVIANPWRAHLVVEQIFALNQDFDVTWTFGDLRVVMQGLIDVWELHGKSLKESLDILASRDRGLGWYIWVDESDPEEPEAVVQFFTFTPVQLSLGTFVLPANPNVVAFQLPGPTAHPHMVEALEIKYSHTTRVKQIWVRTARRIMMCASFGNREAPATLTSNWPAAMVAAYQADTPEGRHDEKYNALWSRFIVPLTWNGRVGSGDGTRPLFNTSRLSNGIGWILQNTFSNLWRGNKFFESYLPLLSGYDYSVPRVNGQPVNNNVRGQDVDYLPMFAIINDIFKPNDPLLANKYWYVDRLGEAAARGRTFASSGSVTPLNNDFGVQIRFSPRHYIAGPDVNPNILFTPEFEWRDIIVTGFFELDFYQQVSVILPNQIPFDSTLVIEVPEAECWIIAPNTVIGIQPNGRPLLVDPSHAYPNLLRDGSQLLNQVATLASQWFSEKDRNAIQIVINYVSNDNVSVPLGYIITQVLSVGKELSRTNVNAVVTSRTHNYNRGQTTTDTDFLALHDPAKLIAAIT